MLAGYEWRLDVRLHEGGGSGWVPLRVRRAARRLALRLPGVAPRGVMIIRHERDPAALLVFGSSMSQIQTVQRQVESLLGGKIVDVSIALDQWSETENRWNQVRGPDDREIPIGRHGQDDSQVRYGVRVVWLTAAVLLAAGGITVYALTPYTFGAYQASTFGIMPLLISVLIWLNRRLPMSVQWSAAVVLFALGVIGYLIFSGAYWWNWGQLTAMPLLLLVFGRVSDREPPLWEPSFPEPPPGPFGPP